MCKGTSTFTRSTRPEKAEPDIHEELAEMIHQEADVNTKLDSWGNPVPAPQPQQPVAGHERRDEPAA
jgi:hypothetical protein